ncbi:hypothetical protein Tco_0378744 [Tanacetum coccineum]
MVMEMVEETIVAPTKDLWRVDLETLKELAVKVALTRWIEKMESALLTTEFSLSNEIEKLEGEFWNHSMSFLILTVGILTDEAVRKGTLAKAGKKRKERDEASKSESVGKDEKKAKGG